MRISKEVKVGVLAIVSITILYFGFNYLKGIDFRSSSNRYFLVFNKIGDLKPSNPVVVEGLSVGRVAETFLAQDLNNKIIVAIDVESDVKLAQGTVGELYSVLMGDTGIKLKLAGSTPPYHNDGDTLLSFFDEGMFGKVEELMGSQAAPMIDSLKLTIAYLNKTLQSTTRTIAGVNAMLDENRYSMKSTMQNLNKGTDSLSYLISDARKMMQGLAEVSDTLKSLQLNETLVKAQEMMAGISTNMEAIKNQEGTMGKLMYNDSLYNNLNLAMANLDSLFIDLRENPGRYVHVSVFGKKDKDKKK